MKTSLKDQKNETGGLKPDRHSGLRFVAVLACLCVGTGLLLPVIKTSVERQHSTPPGQLMADARTFVAEVRYLFTPETDDVNVATGHETNLATLGQRTTVGAWEVSDRFYDPTKLPTRSSTNPPAQS